MHLPGPLRAAVGLAATAADETRRLPERALELPMLVVSTALQASVRAQQRYARLTARGDEVLNRAHPTDEPPSWATFDDPLSEDELQRAPSRFDAVDPLPVDSATQTARLVGELVGADDDAGEQARGAPNGARPDAPAWNPADEWPRRTAAAGTQPRQPPARSEQSAEPADTSPSQTSRSATPDSESADY